MKIILNIAGVEDWLLAGRAARIMVKDKPNAEFIDVVYESGEEFVVKRTPKGTIIVHQVSDADTVAK